MESSQHGMSERPEVVKASFNLPKEELESLKRLAMRRSVPVTQALRQAIVSELFLQDLADRGAKLLAKQDGEPLQEIVFSQTQATPKREHVEDTVGAHHATAT